MHWILALRIYVVGSLIGHLVWEIVQLPLYTIWWSGTAEQVAVAVLHCFAGDFAIASTTLVAALIIGGSGWPQTAPSVRNVMWLSIGLGAAYTIYSEWQNVSVRGSWDYTAWMPRVPPLGTGLAPLLQWLVVPRLAFLVLARWPQLQAIARTLPRSRT